MEQTHGENSEREFYGRSTREELHVEIENSMEQTQEITNTARDRISSALQIITDAARDQDEALDRARSRAIVDIQRVASA
eukprot:577149-Karenia_brevis.AAC.1